MIAIGVVNIPIFTRLMRGSILAQRDNDYVSRRARSACRDVVLASHILPERDLAGDRRGDPRARDGDHRRRRANLGLGPQDPATPEWGTMLVGHHPLPADRAVPGDLPRDRIVIAVMGFNLIGDGAPRGARPEAARTGVSEAPFLEVDDLRVRFWTQRGLVHGQRHLVRRSARRDAGLVGESAWEERDRTRDDGDPLARGTDPVGSIKLDGRELLGLSERAWRRIRGKEIAMIFQDPMTSLNPVLTVGPSARRSRSTSTSTARDRPARPELLDQVGIPSAADSLKNYPHQFSGGMRQRVMIAMALACEPKLLIADEPTTALDVTIQAQILDLLRKLVSERGTALVLITHDLGVVAGTCERVQVMYAGTLVETAPRTSCSAAPRHPYTLGLLQRAAARRRRRQPLRPIPGAPRNMLSEPDSPVRTSLPLPVDRCTEELPVLEPLDTGQRAACFNPAPRTSGAARGSAARRRERTGTELPGRSSSSTTCASGSRSRGRPARSPRRRRQGGRRRQPHDRAGETLGLWASRAAASRRSAARCCGSTSRPVSRALRGHRRHEALRFAAPPLRRRMQMVFQDPYASLNPRHSVGRTIAEPLRVHGIARGSEADTRVREILEVVGLPPDAANRYPHEFSGGQRQRIGLAGPSRSTRRSSSATSRCPPSTSPSRRRS